MTRAPELENLLPLIRSLHETIRDGVVAACERSATATLAAVAREHGEETNLSHIELAVQTEIPLVKQHLSDCLWSIRGHGAHAERFNRLTGERSELLLQPSREPTIAHGYAGVVRFFPGAREV